MKSKWIRTLTATLLFGAATASPQAPAAQAGAKQVAGKKGMAGSSAPTDAEIADAKGKGMVWVNTSTKVFHKDGDVYGKTKRGKFMTESDAIKAGYRAAKDAPTSKKAAPPKK